jgi:hypothetical protein
MTPPLRVLFLTYGALLLTRIVLIKNPIAKSSISYRPGRAQRRGGASFGLFSRLALPIQALFLKLDVKLQRVQHGIINLAAR